MSLLGDPRLDASQEPSDIFVRFITCSPLFIYPDPACLPACLRLQMFEHLSIVVAQISNLDEMTQQLPADNLLGALARCLGEEGREHAGEGGRRREHGLVEGGVEAKEGGGDV